MRYLAKNQQIILAARPHGEPKPEDFRLVECPIPQTRDGVVLLQTLWLSLDPYMRSRMDAGAFGSLDIGQVMCGDAVSQVTESKTPTFHVGDAVLGFTGWQTHAVWADRFEGGLEDVFDLQDQVTASVIGAVAPRLEEAEIRRTSSKPTDSLGAYD